MIDREQFAADVYLRLLETPGRQEEWLRAEAVRLADEFIEAIKPTPPKPKPKQREKVNV